MGRGYVENRREKYMVHARVTLKNHHLSSSLERSFAIRRKELKEEIDNETELCKRFKGMI